MDHNLNITHIPLEELAHLKGNPRKGDVDAVAESMDENGIYQPIIVNLGTKTGRKNEIIAGNHRALAAKQLGHTTIPAIVLDLTETEATKIALADNRTSDLAEYDHQALLDMLDSLNGDTYGTGYDDDALDELRNQLDELGADLLEEPENADTPPNHQLNPSPAPATSSTSASPASTAETPPTPKASKCSSATKKPTWSGLTHPTASTMSAKPKTPSPFRTTAQATSKRS